MNSEKNKSATLGFINSILLVVVIFLPVLAACVHLQNLHEHLLLQAESRQIVAARFELNRFNDDLEPRTFIEKAMKSMEKDLGLLPDPKFPLPANSVLYDHTTTEKIRRYLEQNYQLKPIFIALPTKNGREFHSFFSNDFAVVPANDKNDLIRIVSGTMMKTLMKSSAHQVPEVRGRLSRIMIHDENLFDVDREVISGIMAQYFAPAMHFSENRGVCETAFTTRFESRQIFIYFNGLFKFPDFHGGFLTVFAERDLPKKTILQHALASKDDFRRSFVAGKMNLNEVLFNQKNGISCYKIPGASVVTRALAVEPDTDAARQKHLLLKVFSERKIFLGSLSKNLQLVRMFKKLSLLTLITLLIFAGIRGITPVGMLRSKFLMLVGLIVLLPYAITGYLAGITFDRVEKMRRQACLEEANARLYEVNRLISDYSLRRQLVALSEKRHIAFALKKRHFGETTAELSKRIRSQSFQEELHLFERSGRITTYHQKENIVKEPYQLLRFMGFTYLENLGILERTNAKVKRELELAKFASGFLSSLRRDNVEGQLLRHEGAEVKNLAKLEQMSRMIFFVFPEFFLNDAPFLAISFTVLSDLAVFGRLFDWLEVPTQKFFSDTDQAKRFSFAIGRRSGENIIEKFWPQTLAQNEIPRQLLDFMVTRGFSGYEINENHDLTEAKVWQFNPDSRYISAGIVVLEPERLLKFMFYLLPFAGIVFSVLSLLFLADFLWEIFARPVKSFIPAFARIEQGDFQTSVLIKSGDELELLGNSVNEMTESLRQREKMRRFIPQKLFENMREGSDNKDRQIKKQSLSLLSSDIRGFTSLGEKFPPEEIVSALNEYFTSMEKAIVANGGEIERFIGDAIMAVFYGDTGAESARMALNAGFAMRKNLRLLNLDREARQKFMLENGIGIVTDQAWVVTTGISSGRRVHMVFGEAVKRANELEALTAKFPDFRIAVCENTVKAIKTESFVEIDTDLSAFSPVASGTLNG